MAERQKTRTASTRPDLLHVGYDELPGLSQLDFKRLLKNTPNHERIRTTWFDRHIDVFPYMQRRVLPTMAQDAKTINALVIGAGIWPSYALAGTDSECRKWSYEYLHVANILEQLRRASEGRTDYTVTVLDRDRLVLEAVKRQTNVIAEPSNSAFQENVKYADDFLFWARSREIVRPEKSRFLDKIPFIRRFASMFEHKELAPPHKPRLIIIPPEIRQRIRTVEGNVIDSEIPPADIIFYLNVADYIPDRRQAAERIVASLRPGGALVTNDQELTRHPEDYNLLSGREEFSFNTRILRKPKPE